MSFPTSSALASPSLIDWGLQHCCLQSHPFGQLVRAVWFPATPSQGEEDGALP